MNKQQPSIAQVKDFFLPNEKQIGELRGIIRSESGHKFTYEETKDVAYQLIRFYECLAGGQPILPEGVYESRK